ncbi:MAG: hypothetical protein JWM33_2411 [Caulobacteraceae bacterium]|nr:hypothetical protein [Caulobacteraceae bacterium]
MLTPLAGRVCGGCTACCVHLAIDAPELRKSDGCACTFMRPASGCSIYDTRPRTCRDWYCGWRIMTLSDDMRPDRSNVLLAPEKGDRPGFEKGGLRIILLQEDKAAILRPELVDLVAKCVLAGVPIFLSWGDGDQAVRFQANEMLHDFAGAGDRLAFTGALAGKVEMMAASMPPPSA